MGVLFSRFPFLVSHKDESRIMMLGLDAAGKTTLLYKLKLNEYVNTIPTMGFNVETVTFKGLSFTVWDVGGQDKIRSLWKHYYQDVSCLLYVVDSADKNRMAESRYELNSVLRQKEMEGVPVIILANKKDLPNALSVSEITDNLNLSKLEDRRWHIQSTCATTGEGILETMDKLKSMVKKYHQRKARNS
ncbi:ADP-ribosylation factor-like [Argonauta hians]